MQCASVICLGYFQIGNIINNVLMNNDRHKSLKTSLSITTDNKSLEVVLFGHRKWMVLRFLRYNIPLSSKKVCTRLPLCLAKFGYILCLLSFFLIDDKMRTEKDRSYS